MRSLSCEMIVIYSIASILGLVSSMESLSNESNSTRLCGFYLAPSTVPGAGRGIISGKSYDVGEIIEITSTLTFLADIMLFNTQLNNYVYAFDDMYSIILFGAGSLYNHNKRFTTKHHWIVSAENVVHPQQVDWMPYSGGNDVWFRATEAMVPGEEMYAYYGEDWFTPRAMIEKDSNDTAYHDTTTLVSLNDLETYGHCMTDVYLGQSNIVFAGKGLFAKKDYLKGEIVVISPVLLIPRSSIDSSINSSILMNYCFTLPNNATEVTLFPLNNAIAMNHQPGDSANLILNWYDWSSIPSEGSYYENLTGNALSLSDKLEKSPKELIASPFAQFDIVFRATHDIADGDELTFDYGFMWGEAWNQYVDDLRVWEQQLKSEVVNVDGQTPEVDTSNMPRFRSYIEVPEGMFPSHWLREDQQVAV